MQIRVLKDYGGAPTGDRRIKPGVYDADSERLFGVAAYLVKNGHAVVIEEPPEIAPECAMTVTVFAEAQPDTNADSVAAQVGNEVKLPTDEETPHPQPLSEERRGEKEGDAPLDTGLPPILVELVPADDPPEAPKTKRKKA